jgi:hypothetical protein
LRCHPNCHPESPGPRPSRRLRSLQASRRRTIEGPPDSCRWGGRQRLP